MRKLTVCAGTLVTLLGLSACATNDTTSRAALAEAGAVNTRCPVTGKNADSRYLSSHRGETVALCSPGSLEAWNNMSSAERDAALAAK